MNGISIHSDRNTIIINSKDNISTITIGKRRNCLIDILWNFGFTFFIFDCISVDNLKDDFRLQQIIQQFQNLEEHEKQAVSEMVRIMSQK